MDDKLRVVGLDPSMNNWGAAGGYYDRTTREIKIINLAVTCPVLPKGKQVRQNSKDLAAANQLATGAWAAIKEAQVIFVEVPVGSQSARAMASYGICIGILGAMASQGVHFIEVTPIEVKLAATGKKTATKKQMIDAAMTNHPAAPWPWYKKNGERLISEAKAEHMADACFAIEAGIALPTFQQLMMLGTPSH